MMLATTDYPIVEEYQFQGHSCSFGGRANNFLSESLMLPLPTMAEITLCLIISFTGCNRTLMLSVVLDK
jgi:hypothetical protein